MFLKSVLAQNRAKVFDKDTGKSFGFEKCLRLCQSNHGLTAEEAGIMRAVDAPHPVSVGYGGLVTDDVEISEKDVDRIEKGVKAGKELGKVFPPPNHCLNDDLRGWRHPEGSLL